MGVSIAHIHSYNEYEEESISKETSSQVFQLGEKMIKSILHVDHQHKISHFIVTTSCPDSIAPSLGQALADAYNEELGNSHIIDMVQGCAGGVSALVLASQLVTNTKYQVLVLSVDAAKKACSSQSPIYSIFGNGAFACIVSNQEDSKEFLYSKSSQYKGLSKVVEIKLGHDADVIIKQEKGITKDPRLHLGLNLNKLMARQLIRKAEDFFKDFVAASCLPDMLILHQVNPNILEKLERIFTKYGVEFINMAKEIGNCGSATTGIALHAQINRLLGKNVMICSFGTGGLITAGMWKF